MAIEPDTLYGLKGSQVEDLARRINASGSGIVELTSEDYDYPVGAADGVALWELSEGLYSANDGVKVYLSSVASHEVSSNPKMIMVVKDSGATSIYVFTASKVMKVITRTNGSESPDTWGSILDTTDLAQSTGTSTLFPMSQNAVSQLLLNGGTLVPTSSTVGSVGTLYSCVNSGTPEIYMCTAVSGSTYTWTKVI